MWLAKLESPSADRNKLPIWKEVLRGHLLKKDIIPTSESTIRVLEVAAGSGVHTQYLGQRLAEENCEPCWSDDVVIYWQSTDPEVSALASQEAYIEEICTDSDGNDEVSSVEAPAWRLCGQRVQFAKPLPLTLDANGIRETTTDAVILDSGIDWIFNINMIHISPWGATQGLMKMAGKKLKPCTGRLILYGPYRVNGKMVESNVNFEKWLKAMDPGYGVRHLEDVVAEAGKNGLQLEKVVSMPANNLSVIFRKQ